MVKKIHLQCRRPVFNPWVGEIPWRREWLLTPVFLPGEFHVLRSLAGYIVHGVTESDTTEQLTLFRKEEIRRDTNGQQSHEK